MSNYCQHGDDYFSYGTCIRTSLPDGRSVGNVTKYSRTTSRHQGWSMANVEGCDIQVNHVPQGLDARALRALAFRILHPEASVEEGPYLEAVVGDAILDTHLS